MGFLQVLHFQGVCIALQLLPLLLLLPLPLSCSSPCPSTVEEMVVTTTLDANTLAEALLCDGSGSFTVSWHGDVLIPRTVSVSNGSNLNVTASSDSTDADTGAVVTGDGTLLLFEVGLGSTVSLTGLTLYGGDGALRVTGGSSVEAIDCTFTKNNRTSSDREGGAIFVNSSSSIVLKGETVFANNTADFGGAIYSRDGSELNVTEEGRVSFFNNQAGSDGGAILLYNQSVFNSYGTASFVSNEAEHAGGAIYVESNSNIVLKGKTVFANNTADCGGTVYMWYYSDLHVTEGGIVSFLNNHAGGEGVVH